jgi:hypothetical protein
MAISKSTTTKTVTEPLPAQIEMTLPTQFDPRFLTVRDYTPTNTSLEAFHLRLGRPPRAPAPSLRLQGRWLDQAGFAIGSKVRVDALPGRLVIETLPESQERASRLPRSAPTDSARDGRA